MQKLPIKAFAQPQEYCFQTSWIFNAFGKKEEGRKRINTDIFRVKYFNIFKGPQNVSSEASTLIAEAMQLCYWNSVSVLFIAEEKGLNTNSRNILAG